MQGRVVVVGLGPAGPDLVTQAALDAVARVPVRFVRTVRHPSSHLVRPATAFDDVYESSASLDDVYAAVVEALVEAAATEGEVLYAVPGSPAVAERTVELLRADPRVAVDVVPALSFLDLAWVRLGVDPVRSGVRVVDGHRFAAEAAGRPGPLLVAQCDSRAVLSEIKLAFDDDHPPAAVVLQRLGGPDESVREVPWAELDREVEPDHLTSLYLPDVATPVAGELVRFAEIVRELRERCPWDRSQTHHSLARYALEEAYEVVEAIEALERGAPGGIEHLEEELGDLLLQVVLHATIAAQAGTFTLADVARTISAKMVRRHPHVFGDVDVDDAEEVVRNWERLKREEAGGRRASVVDGVPGSLPALAYASALARRAASIGLDWDGAHAVEAKLLEELDELRRSPSADELGDVLFSVVNLARHLGHDPEVALRAAAAKFRGRILAVERLAQAGGVDLADADPAVVDHLWEDAKRAERAGG